MGVYKNCIEPFLIRLRRTVAYFNGEDAYASIASSASLNPTQGITMSCWINQGNKNSLKSLIRKNNQYIIQITSSNAVRPYVYAGGGYLEFISTATLPPGKLTYLTVTYDGENLIVYFDAVEKQRMAGSGLIRTSTSILTFGTWNGSEFFLGEVSDMLLLPFAQTPAQIMESMNGAVPAGAAGYWPLKGDGADYSGNNNHATLHGVTFRPSQAF